MEYLGVIFAAVALFAWGLGDFLIQRSARSIGAIKTLWFNGLIGAVLIFPFVIKDLSLVLIPRNFVILTVTSIVITFTAVFVFKAFKEGKLSVIEPEMGLELPLTVGLGIIFLQEYFTWAEIALIFSTLVGIFFTVTNQVPKIKLSAINLEKGVIYGGVGVVAMSLTNVLIGYSSQEISPLLTIWYTSAFVFVSVLIFIYFRERRINFIQAIKSSPFAVIGQGIIDNVAWLSFAFAVLYINIGTAVAISESYIILVVLLGVIVNKERIKPWQIFGVVLTTLSIITLAWVVA